MITRTAIFEGRIRPGCEEAFFAAVRDRLAPLWAQFPRAIGVRWSRVVGTDSDAPPIVMIQQIDYPTQAAMAEAITSQTRDRARAVTLEILEMFEGRFYHVVGDAFALEGAREG